MNRNRQRVAAASWLAVFTACCFAVACVENRSAMPQNPEAELAIGMAVMPVSPAIELHGTSGGTLPAYKMAWPCYVSTIERDRYWLYSQSGDCWVRRDEVVSVLAAIARYSARLSDLHPRADDTEWLKLRADCYLYGESYRSAVSDYLEAWRRRPTESQMALAAAAACLDSGQFHDAIEICDLLVGNWDCLGAAHHMRGAAKAELQDLPGALLDLDQAILADPENTHAFGFRGMVWMACDEPDKALQDFARAGPPAAELCYLQAIAYEAKSDFDSAIERTREGLRITPDHTGLTYLHIGIHFATNSELSLDTSLGEPRLMAEAFGATSAMRDLSQGQETDAIAILNKVIPLQSPGLPQLLVLRAEAYRRLGKSKLGFADANSALELVPTDAMALSTRGRCLLELHDVEGAICDFEQAVKSDPRSVDGYLGLSGAHRALGDFESAYASLAPVLELNSNDPQALLSRATLHLQQHAADLAIADCTAALRALNRPSRRVSTFRISDGRYRYDSASLRPPVNFSTLGEKVELLGCRAYAEASRGQIGRALADIWRIARLGPVRPRQDRATKH